MAKRAKKGGTKTTAITGEDVKQAADAMRSNDEGEATQPPLPAKEYVERAARSIDAVNEHKEMEERLLRRIDTLYLANDYYDRRWLAIAKTHIEQGFMALNRAVLRLQWLTLPEDKLKK